MRPGRPETHSRHVTAALEGIGLEVGSRRVVSDETREIVAAVSEARAGSRLVLVTGGIGPTRDDRTRDALAEVLGRPLRLDRGSERAIARWCRRHRFPFTAAQRRQAFLPEGSRALPNSAGSAPGIWTSDPRGVLVALPGVLGEMRAMLASLLPRLLPLATGGLATAVLRTAGRGESSIDARIAPVIRRSPGIEVTTLASPGEVTIQLRARGRGAGAAVARCRKEVARRLGTDLVSESGETLEERVLHLLRRRRLRLATAESCTGGLVAARITSVPGSSRAFVAGAVCYNDRAKARILSVSSEILSREGAVSRPVALAMAKGAAVLAGCEVAVAVTGIAGPGGGSRRQPVGTVHWVVVAPGVVRSLRRRLPGGREKVRCHAAAIALDLVRRALLSARRTHLPGGRA